MRKLLPVAAVVAIVATGWFAWQRVSSGGAGPRPVSILLVSIDTLRADRLGSYGYTAAATPVLDSLAARGLRFAQAATVAPLTLPAHVSLLTGTFPTFHGVRDNGSFYADDKLTTLAETLKTRGYRTGAFVGAFVLDRRWGLAQGFDQYADGFDLSRFDMTVGLDAAQHPGNEVVDKALAWLQSSNDDQPFFAWVHLYDPHAPYDPPEPYRSRFAATVQGAYDGEVAATDAQVGRLLQHLERGDQLSRTLVVVVGDHGESLGEHDEQQHGFFVYDAAIRIPLIVAGPGVPARVVSEQVRIVDVMPTVLQLAGVNAPAETQGVSLMPLTEGKPLDLLGFSETWYPRYHYGWSELRAVKDGRYKFISAPRRELYDTETDRGETQDIAASRPQLANALERALQEIVARTSADAKPAAPRSIDPEVESRLRALGYVASSVTRAALEDKPRGDPKDMIRLYNLLKLAGSDSVAGNIEAGIAKVRQVLAVDPAVIEAHTMLGNMHSKAGRTAEAIAAYKQALAVDPEHEGAAWSLALAYRQAGRLEEAEAGFERVLQLNPRGAKSLYQLADLAMQRREFARAAELLEKGLTLDGDRAAFLVKLGEARIELKQFDAAQASLQEAIKTKGDQAMAHYNLALVHEARGDFAAAAGAYQAEIAASPKLYQPHFNLAKILQRANRQPEALQHYRAAVEKNPAFGTGWLYLSKALLDAGDLQEAETAALRGLQSSPDAAMMPLGHYVLADVYARLGRNAESAKHAAAGQRAERQMRGGARP